MQNKKLIRIMEMFVVMPMLTVSVPFADVQKTTPDDITPPSIVSKIHTKALNLLAFNDEVDIEALEAAKLAEIRKIRAQAIDDFFEARKAPLAGTGMKMIIEAEKNGLDWRLLPGIATRESNAGKEACKKVKFSAFGWGSCKINFDSYEQSIEVVAKNLGGNNEKTKRYYADKTTYEILRVYNPAHIVLKYPEQVLKIMDMIGPIDLGENPESEKTEA